MFLKSPQKVLKAFNYNNAHQSDNKLYKTEVD